MLMPDARLTRHHALGLEAIRSPHDEVLPPVSRLRRLAALEHGDIAVVVVYAIAIGLVSLAVPIAVQSLVNTGSFTGLLQPVVALSVLVLVGLLAAGLLRVLQHTVVETLQQRFFVRATHDSVRRLAQVEIGGFANRGAQELMNRFFEVASIQKAASTLLLDGLSVVLQGAVSLILLAFYHPALLAYAAVLIAFIAFIIVGLGRQGVSTAIKESKAKYATAAWLEEMAVAVRTFKAPAAETFAFARADGLARDYLVARKRHFKVLLRQIVGSYLLQAIATAGLLGIGGSLVVAGQLTLGQLVAAELIVTGVLAGVAKFGKYLENYYDLVASVDKIGVIVDLPSERVDGSLLHARTTPARLVLEEVTFAPDGTTPALTDISLEVAPGAWLAVVGNDASGIGTLADLLYGLRAPTRGRISLDGVDLRTLALGALRAQVALVGRTELFDASVLENLQLGRSAIDASRVAEVLATVVLTDEIGSLPKGAATRLGHLGGLLTASQASRLMIARALLAEPRVLLLDQSLDGLGIDMVRTVLRGIAAACPGLVVVVFTHRIEIAVEVGDLVQLDSGVVYRGQGGTA